jgi:hypothetical protein
MTLYYKRLLRPFRARNDTSNFASGNDTSNFASGNDTSNFAPGNDTSNFASGNDTSNFAPGKADVTLLLATTYNHLTFGPGLKIYQLFH